MPRVTYGEPKHACPHCNYLLVGKSDPEFAGCRCPKPTLEALARQQSELMQRAMRRNTRAGH